MRSVKLNGLKPNLLSLKCHFDSNNKMKIKSLALAIVVVLSAGCATPHRASQPNPAISELQFYISSNKPRAESGAMKWSDYYAGLYDRHVAAGMPPELIQGVNQLWWNAQQYDKNAISKDEFEFKQRELRLQVTATARRLAAADEAQQQARTALALQMMQASQPRPLTLAPIGSSAPVLPAPPVQVTANAYWTGKQQQVQTVTYQSGWSCEYNYAGRTFWRTFVGTCPSSIQVQ